MPLIDRKQLAAELGLSVRTVEKLSTKPGFPVYRFGRARRYALADVLVWFASGGSLARPKPTPTTNDDMLAVQQLVAKAIAAGYPAEAEELRAHWGRVGPSSAIVSTLAQRVRAIIAASRPASEVTLAP